MKHLTLENYIKVVQMIRRKGYDLYNAEKIAMDIFRIIEKHGNTAEFYIEYLSNQK